MKQFDALILSIIGLAWLSGVIVTYMAITVYSAIKRYEKRERPDEVPGESIDPFEGIDLTVRNSEQPYVC